ncbi:hypothetical protein KXW15_008418, partial [Aspergillus fumigatus]
MPSTSPKSSSLHHDFFQPTLKYKYNTLGKVFYKSSKRPIPIRIAEIEKVDGKK